MGGYRLTAAAQADIIAILTWSEERFGEAASHRYEALIIAAIRGAASGDGLGRKGRPELGDGVFSWHLAQARSSTSGMSVRRPRHLLVCRDDGEAIVVVRVLHEAMVFQRHIDPHQT